MRDQLLMRSHSLTYLTLLSIVPMLALVATFGDLVGAREQIIGLIQEQLSTAVPDATEYLVGFVQGLDFRQLGAGAGAVLVFTTILAVGNAEKALNAVWGVQEQRSWLRRIPDYLALLVIAPLLVGPALAMRGALESQTIVQRLMEIPGLEALLTAGLTQVPTIMLVVAFSFLYWFLPNTDVKAGPALLGGLVAALLFTLLQKAFVQVTGGAAARFGAMFGTFASVPIFMLWVYYSWAVTLLGAEVSYATQTLPRYRREVRGTPAGPAARETLGLAIAAEVARAFRTGRDPWTTEALSAHLDVPLRVVREVMAELQEGGIVRPCAGEGDPGYQLGRSADSVRVVDVLVALRGERTTEVQVAEVQAVVAGVLGEIDHAADEGSGQRTLKDLVDAMGATA